MTPAVAAAFALATAERLSLGRRDRVELVARNAEVAHVYVGPITRSGRFASTRGSIVCHTRARRLRVVQRRQGALDLRGRRVCGRCLAVLLPGAGKGPLPVNRDTRAAVLDGVEYAHLAATLHLVTTVTESHEFGSVLLMQVPDTIRRRPLEQRLNAHRNTLRVAERTPDEQAEIDARKEADAAMSARIAAGRARQAIWDRNKDRENRGIPVFAHEQLPDSA